jgi:SAM-dependent methyltransferase
MILMKQRIDNTFGNMSLKSKLVMLARLYLPFTALNTVWRSLDKQSRSILDLGCGRGEPMRYLGRHKELYSVGVDIWKPTILEAKGKLSHDDYLLCDIKKLPVKTKSFDTVMCLEVLEHLDKESGLNLLREMESIARNQVIISTPLGDYETGVLSTKGNPYQLHVYMWKPADLKKRGYKVKLLGLRHIGGENGLVVRVPKNLRYLLDIVYVLAGPLARLFHGLAGEMVCIKKIGAEDSSV